MLYGQPAVMLDVGKLNYLLNSIAICLHYFFRPATVEHQHSAFKHFFSYVDTIETKVRLNDSISRKEFEAIVKAIIGEGVDPNEIDLFFEILDSDKNDCIEISELPPLPALRYQHQKLRKASTIVRKPKVKKFEDTSEVLELNKDQRVMIP